MEYRRLGRSDMQVSSICLGTMTWGEQNNEAEAHAQMDYAFGQGVNFFDTAEIYAVPPRAETYGRTEEIIGTWFKAQGKRDKVILATKVAGRSAISYIRDGKTRLNRKNIMTAVEDSLCRLQTDYIDLYQFHWPDRPIRAFGHLGYEHNEDDDPVPIEEALAALGELMAAGKIRAAGLSNETPWGVMKFLALAEAGKGPRMATVQNPYSFLNRSFEARLAEVALREDCGLLGYAPLGAGMLTGKYLNGQQPANARLTLYPQNTRYTGERALAATADYVALAREQGLDPAQMAIAFVASRPFTTAAIIGATSQEQLATNIAAKDLVLDQAVLEGIEDLHRSHTYPCP